MRKLVFVAATLLAGVTTSHAAGQSCSFAYITDYWWHTGGQKVCVTRNNYPDRTVRVMYVTQPPRAYPISTLAPGQEGRMGPWAENVDARCVLVSCEFADDKRSLKKGRRAVKE